VSTAVAVSLFLALLLVAVWAIVWVNRRLTFAWLADVSPDRKRVLEVSLRVSASAVIVIVATLPIRLLALLLLD
jgi:hypothetical protein